MCALILYHLFIICAPRVTMQKGIFFFFNSLRPSFSFLMAPSLLPPKNSCPLPCVWNISLTLVKTYSLSLPHIPCTPKRLSPFHPIPHCWLYNIRSWSDIYVNYSYKIHDNLYTLLHLYLLNNLFPYQPTKVRVVRLELMSHFVYNCL